MDTVEAVIATIRDDRRSGSSALLARGVELLQRIAADRAGLVEAAAQLCRAQPAMAGFRTLAGLVGRTADPTAALERFALQIARAPSAIARNALSVLRLRKGCGPLRVVTCSASQAVEAALVAAGAEFDLVVCCAEGRPHLEGRDLARRLAAAGLAVEFYTDAAIGAAIPSAEAVLIGADAIGPEGFINKVGTAALCGLARSAGVPVYVLAGREKALGAGELASLQLGGGPPDEVWSDPPMGVSARNPYFEYVRMTSVSAVISDTAVANI